MSSLNDRIPEWAVATTLVVVAILVYVQFGPNGSLYRDDGLYMYAGQQFAQGVPPYVSLFASKGVVAPMLAGVGVLIGNAIEMDDLLAARLFFLLLSALTVGAVYLLGRDVFASRRAGVFSALTFLCFWGFGRFAMAGPRVKTPMALFEVLALWCMTNRRWFAAGMMASLSTLTWQPAGLFAVAAVAMAFFASEPGHRLRSVALALAGGLLPLAACVAYYAAHDAVPEFYEGFVTASLGYGGRAGLSGTPFLTRFTRVLYSVNRGYLYAPVAIWLGFLMILAAYFVRGEGRGLARIRSLAHDPIAPLLISFPAVVLWTLIDYQGYPDFFIVLPFVAVGFGWLLHLAANELATRVGPRAERLWCVAWGALFILGGGLLYGSTSDHLLPLQRAQAHRVAREMGDGDWTLLTLDKPGMNVLLHKRNATRYLLLMRSIEQMIVEGEPGRFRGWLGRLQATQPDVVWVGSLHIQRKAWIQGWLEAYYEQPFPDQKAIWRRKKAAGE